MCNFDKNNLAIKEFYDEPFILAEPMTCSCGEIFIETPQRTVEDFQGVLYFLCDECESCNVLRKWGRG